MQASKNACGNGIQSEQESCLPAKSRRVKAVYTSERQAHAFCAVRAVRQYRVFLTTAIKRPSRQSLKTRQKQLFTEEYTYPNPVDPRIGVTIQ